MNKASVGKKLNMMEQQAQEVSLTEIERQCILQFIQNKTPDSIGEHLDLRQNSVQFFLMNAGKKLLLVGKNKL